MKRYIKADYYDDEPGFAFDNAPHIFGYKFFSTMTGIIIMFCHEDEDYLAQRVHKIYEFLMETEDAEGEYERYCEEQGIKIVDDEYGDLTEIDNTYVAEIDDVQYVVDVIAEDKGRF